MITRHFCAGQTVVRFVSMYQPCPGRSIFTSKSVLKYQQSVYGDYLPHKRDKYTGEKREYDRTSRKHHFPKGEDDQNSRIFSHREKLDARRRVAIPRYRDGRNITRDPMVVGGTAQNMLRFGKQQEAFALIHRAGSGRGIKTVRAWNMLIQKTLEIGKIDLAFKIYNQMKKRGNTPDHFTYQILLSGIQKVELWKPKYLETAINLYERMCSSDDARPDVQHSNMFLQVARRAKDFDALWSIFTGMPVSGRGAPDIATYTIMLKATSESSEEGKIEYSKRVWARVLSQWGRGAFVPDDGLISTMMFACIESPRRDDQLEAFRIAEHIFGLDLIDPESKEEKKFTPKTPANPPKPTEKILIPLLKAAHDLKDQKLANRSWDAVVNKGNLEPSERTFLLLLYALQKTHDGQTALDTLRAKRKLLELYKSSLPYTVALRACFHGNQGAKHSQQAAESILELAEAQKFHKDYGVLQAYLDAAVGSRDPGYLKTALRRFREIRGNERETQRERGWELYKTVEKCIMQKRLKWIKFEKKWYDDWLETMRKSHLERWIDEERITEEKAAAEEAERVRLSQNIVFSSKMQEFQEQQKNAGMTEPRNRDREFDNSRTASSPSKAHQQPVNSTAIGEHKTSPRKAKLEQETEWEVVEGAEEIEQLQTPHAHPVITPETAWTPPGASLSNRRLRIWEDSLSDPTQDLTPPCHIPTPGPPEEPEPNFVADRVSFPETGWRPSFQCLRQQALREGGRPVDIDRDGGGPRITRRGLGHARNVYEKQKLVRRTKVAAEGKRVMGRIDPKLKNKFGWTKKDPRDRKG